MECRFEVYPNASENKTQIFKKYFQLFEQEESERETILKGLYEDEPIYEEIKKLEDKIIFMFNKGNAVLVAEVEVGTSGLFADFG